MINSSYSFGGAVAQLGARLDGIEEVVGSNPIGSTILKQKTSVKILSRFTARPAAYRPQLVRPQAAPERKGSPLLPPR